jgi:hypothetical protein
MGRTKAVHGLGNQEADEWATFDPKTGVNEFNPLLLFAALAHHLYASCQVSRTDPASELNVWFWVEAET